MDCDIIIVGGGPTGLAFARSLAGSSLSIILIERQPIEALAQPAPDGREIALTHRSVRILQDLGAWQHFEPADVAPLRRARVLNGASPFALSFEADGGDGGMLGYLVPNHRIRNALFRVTADLPNLRILAGTGVSSARGTPTGAIVMLTDGRQLRTRLIVAADSRMSAVRERLGITAEINRLGRSMLVCRVAHAGDHQGIATEWFEHRYTMAMLPLNGRHSSAVLTLPSAEADALAARDQATLGAELTRRYHGRLGHMDVVGRAHVYPLATTCARHFVATRAALIGDAAIGMHPVTAHGFNLGLRGQASLAGLIRAAHSTGRDIAAPTLLRRYEAAHRLAGLPLYAATNLLVRLYTWEDPISRGIRHVGLRLGKRLPLAKEGITALLMQQASGPKPEAGMS